MICQKRRNKNQNASSYNNIKQNIPEVNDEKLENQKEVYRCPNCLIVPEITNINYSENKILLECPFHKDNLLDINDYLNSLDFNLCQICDNKILSKDISYYCNQCKKIICINCQTKHQRDHFLINLNEYNIKCQIHYGNNYEYYCYNCSSNLCQTCFDNHDNMHNIIPLLNIYPKKEELDFIYRKNEEYNKMIQIYQNYISLNFLIIETYNNFKNNFYYMKNIKNLIRFLKSSEINDNIINTTQKNLEQQSSILEKFNSEFETELTLDSDVIYLNWKNITQESLESLTKIEFKKLNEFQSVGTWIDDISFLNNSKFPILQELYLTDNNICDISVLEKVNFPILKIIYLNKNKIKDIKVFKKVHFPELNKLFLDDNNISDISVLDNLPFDNLENLKLSKNEISDISVLRNIKLKFLRIIDIKKNKIDYNLQENLDIINDLRDKSIRVVY